MRLLDGAFKTEVDDEMFNISITKESDCSMDGGYTFEDVTNTWELNQQTAKDLYEELKEYLGV